MIRAKVCMLGSYAVGKTSLVQRYVHGRYSDRYLSTVGVKIDRREVTLSDGTEVHLLVWDIHGDDDFQRVPLSYLRGAAGLFLVADCTRPRTLDKALSLADTAAGVAGAAPTVIAINKCDLTDERLLHEEQLSHLAIPHFETSALTGQGVESTFLELGERIAATRRDA